MKFKIFITILLFLFSLFYIKKSSMFIQENDKLMQELKQKQDIYNIKEVNAIKTLHTMIPGISGKRINLNKSYQKMKRLSKFNESLLVYDEIPPSISIQNTYDKVIISGNKQKNKISLIIEIDNLKLFNLINNILVDNNVYADILSFTNYSLLNTNYQSIVSTKYYSYVDYCLTYGITVNKECQNNKKLTIMGTDINNYHLNKTKDVIKNGIILVYHFNENNYQELSIIIHYFKNNNYQIIPINELIKE